MCTIFIRGTYFSNLQHRFSQGTTRKTILDAVKPFLPQIISWIGEYVRDHPTVGVGKLDLKLPPGHIVKELGIDPFASKGKGKTNFEVEAALTKVMNYFIISFIF